MLYIIDVSQSVEQDHPHALDFLRKDCQNVNDFFSKNGANVLTLRQLYEFITDEATDFDLDERFEEVLSFNSH